MKIAVRDNNISKAYRKLKKALHNEGVIQELMDKKFYQKPSDVKRKKRKDAIRRSKNALAKRLAEWG